MPGKQMTYSPPFDDSRHDKPYVMTDKYQITLFFISKIIDRSSHRMLLMFPPHILANKYVYLPVNNWKVC